MAERRGKTNIQQQQTLQKMRREDFVQIWKGGAGPTDDCDGSGRKNFQQISRLAVAPVTRDTGVLRPGSDSDLDRASLRRVSDHTSLHC